jgi:hypothetical protein
MEDKFGIFKLKGERLRQFYEFCNNKSLNPNEELTQIEYTFYEIVNNPKVEGNLFRKSTSIEEAAALFHTYILEDMAGYDRTVRLAYEFKNRYGS